MTVSGPPDDYTDKLKAAMVGVFGDDPAAVEIRRNDDGSIDEVVADNCSVHIEQMSDSEWWMRIGKEVFWFVGFKINGKPAVRLKHTDTE